MSRAIAVHHGSFGRAILYHHDRDMTVHAHREAHLAFHLDGPSASFVVDGERIVVNAAQAAAVNPWRPHSFEVEDQSVGTISLILYIRPQWFSEFQDERGVRGLSFGRDTIVVTKAIQQYVTRISELMASGEQPEILAALLYELTRESCDQTWRLTPGSALSMPGRDFCDYRVRNSIRLIETKLKEELEIEEVARDVGLSRPHFFKLFKKQMGVSPNIFANTLRMEFAIDELTRGEKSITEISYDLCFSSQASFSRFFSLNAGMSPTNYRQVLQCAR